MYNIYKEGVIMGLVDSIPTPEQLSDLNCDSYELYQDPEGTPEARKERVRQSLVSSPDISKVELEDITFSDIEIGDIILDRVFSGNPHAESALQAKISSYLLSVIAGQPDDSLLKTINDKQTMVNKVREKFNLNPF